MTPKLIASIALLSAAGLAVACGGRNSGENKLAPAPTAGCPPGQAWNGQMCVAETAPPPTGSTTTTPTTTTTGAGSPIPTAASGPTATPLDATSASVATQALDLLAKQSAPGAHPVLGQALAGNFAQGQTLEATFQAEPGKCYTVVGAGLPNVQNLDVQIVAQTPIPGFGSPVLSTDQTQSPNAVAAAAPNCFKWALLVSAPLKLVMTVSAGQGTAAAQVYAK
jgi:hypothetical protein